MAVSARVACELARALPGVSEKDHFGSDAFIAHKRTFATVWPEDKKVNLKFSAALQREFLAIDGEAFMEIDNGFGRMGWTTCQLDFVDRATLARALEAAWECSKKPTKRRAS